MPQAGIPPWFSIEAETRILRDVSCLIRYVARGKPNSSSSSSTVRLRANCLARKCSYHEGPQVFTPPVTICHRINKSWSTNCVLVAYGPSAAISIYALNFVSLRSYLGRLRRS